jgi:hypothetical protein
MGLLYLYLYLTLENLHAYRTVMNVCQQAGSSSDANVFVEFVASRQTRETRGIQK